MRRADAPAVERLVNRDCLATRRRGGSVDARERCRLATRSRRIEREESAALVVGRAPVRPSRRRDGRAAGTHHAPARPERRGMWFLSWIGCRSERAEHLGPLCGRSGGRSRGLDQVDGDRTGRPATGGRRRLAGRRCGNSGTIGCGDGVMPSGPPLSTVPRYRTRRRAARGRCRCPADNGRADRVGGS